MHAYLSRLAALLLPALFWIPTAATQPAPRILHLNTLIAEALAANPLLAAGRLEAEAMATRPAQASALPDPSAMAGYRPFAAGGVDALVPSQLRFQQMIPYPGKRRLAGQSATYSAEAAARDADALALEIVFAVKHAYYELYRIQQHDRLIDTFQEQLDAFEEAAAVKYEVGRGAQQEILKAQLERNTLARRHLALLAERHTQLERLARLTHRPGLTAGMDTTILMPLDTTFFRPGTAQDGLFARPEADALRLRLQQADADIAFARAAYRPDFMVGFGLMDMMNRDPVAPLDNLGRRFMIEAGIILPLQRKKRDAALEETRLRRRQLEARYEALQTEIETELDLLRYRLQEEASAVTLYRTTLIPQAETTLEATLSAYTTGRTGFLDLLDAERTRFEVRMDYETAFADLLKTRATLERTLGLYTPGTEPSAPSDDQP